MRTKAKACKQGIPATASELPATKRHARKMLSLRPHEEPTLPTLIVDLQPLELGDSALPLCTPPGVRCFVLAAPGN